MSASSASVDAQATTVVNAIDGIVAKAGDCGAINGAIQGLAASHKARDVGQAQMQVKVKYGRGTPTDVQSLNSFQTSNSVLITIVYCYILNIFIDQN